jgi:hypothetical protein
VLEATRELITEANFEVTASGISLQAMDSSHVSLVALTLRSDGFEHFRCDRTFSMGMNLNNMAKMLKCAANDDSIHMKAEDGGDTVTFTFESPSALVCGWGWVGGRRRCGVLWVGRPALGVGPGGGPALLRAWMLLPDLQGCWLHQYAALTATPTRLFLAHPPACRPGACERV